MLPQCHRRRATPPRWRAGRGQILVLLLSAPLLAGCIGDDSEPMMAQPRLGDQGRYQIEGAEQDWWAFAWTDDEPAPEGLPDRPLVGLHWWGAAGYDPGQVDNEFYGIIHNPVDPMRYFIDRDTGGILASRHASWSVGGTAQDHLVPVLGSDAAEVDLAHIRVEQWHNPTSACLADPGLRGPLEDSFLLAGGKACIFPGIATPIPGGIEMTDAGTETLWGSHDARHYQGRSDDARIELWLAPNVAYPLQARITTDETTLTYTLTGLQSDGAPVWQQGATPAAPAPATATIPWGSFGPATGESVGEWPLQEAYEQAASELGYDRLHAYLEAHPDAQIYGAWTTGQDERTAVASWWIYWTDGEAEFRLHAQRQRISGPATTLAPPTYMGDEHADGPGLGLFPQAWPEATPALATAIERLEAMGGTPSTWGFQVCTHPSCPSKVTVHAKDHATTSEQGVDPPTPSDGVHASASRGQQEVVLDQNGRTLRTIDSHSEWHVDFEARERIEALQEGSAERPAPTATSAPTGPSDVPAWTWIGGGAIAVLAALLAASSKFQAAIWVGFTRLRNEQILRHPTRARLLQAIEAEPGIHLSQLHRRLDMNKPNLLHHLRKLQHAGAIVEKGDHGRSCYFLEGRIDNKVMAAVPLLKSQAARQILEVIQARPGITLGEAAKGAGIAASTANYHVHRLRGCGLVEAVKEGKTLMLRGTALVHEMDGLTQAH